MFHYFAVMKNFIYFGCCVDVTHESSNGLGVCPAIWSGVYSQVSCDQYKKWTSDACKGVSSYFQVSEQCAWTYRGLLLAASPLMHPFYD